MSWVYEPGNLLGTYTRVVSVYGGFLTTDSEWIPDAIMLADFYRDGWEIYNPTTYKHESDTRYKFRTTFKKVVNNGSEV